MRNLIPLVASSFIIVAAPAIAAQPIDLNQPGAMEQLQKDRPEHYAKVITILEEVLKRPEATVPTWMKTTFDANRVSFGPIVLTSYPPKKQLGFELDKVSYKAIVTVTDFKVKPTPLK